MDKALYWIRESRNKYAKLSPQQREREVKEALVRHEELMAQKGRRMKTRKAGQDVKEGVA